MARELYGLLWGRIMDPNIIAIIIGIIVCLIGIGYVARQTP